GTSTAELDARSANLGRAERGLDDAEKRIGQGGPQPPANDSSALRREKALTDELDHADKESQKARGHYTDSTRRTAAISDSLNRPKADLDKGMKAGNPDEIQRLTDNLQNAQRAADRALRNPPPNPQAPIDEVNRAQKALDAALQEQPRSPQEINDLKAKVA